MAKKAQAFYNCDVKYPDIYRKTFSGDPIFDWVKPEWFKYQIHPNNKLLCFR